MGIDLTQLIVLWPINYCQDPRTLNAIQTTITIQKHWWTPELDELKQKCIEATDLWKSSGDINNNRIRCKLQYKNAIKEAAASADSSLNDTLYDKLSKQDNTTLWKAWRKRVCSTNLKPASTISGSSGDVNIREEFTNYFKSVVTPISTNADDKYMVRSILYMISLYHWSISVLFIYNFK